ncbi:unnamed protein product [Acanthoscelides obtectus]|uniref:Uncharacterized protein n=1 Tax=Acanthoscelides obtectus TaxID=200917 RepID=A0A9P0LYY8_ACAOB|nr:unnamed protein product [Acanthoscelides obtectus]CAK1668437.1 hypothetical protein AOBTE_LOCUS26392 [Acanthoscelides obtectus]
MNSDNQGVLSGHNSANSENSSQRPPPTTSVPTDLRVNTTALNAVALSSVAKYWVLTNLLPGPIPQVSVYGLPGTSRDNQGKIPQDAAMLSQHGILPTDPSLLLQQHAQIPVSISTSQGNISIPAGAIQLEGTHINPNQHQNDAMAAQNQMTRDIRMAHTQQQAPQQAQHQQQQQQPPQPHQHGSQQPQQQNMVQVQLQAGQLQMTGDNQLNQQQALTVQQLQQLQVQQVLDNVVREKICHI